METVLIVILGGLLAGVITGLVGASAAVVITPLFVTALGMDPYVAITIALATDVIASGVSAVTYARDGYIRIKSAIPLVITAAIGSVVGSYLATLIQADALSSISVWITFLIGINFILSADKEKKESANKAFFHKHEKVLKIVLGLVVGTLCGFIGAGGGMMILLILTAVLGYELKEAVGTSVFIMAFTALTGALGHVAVLDSVPYGIILISGIASIVGAYGASKFMGRTALPTAKRVAGSILIIIFLFSMAFGG